MSGKEKLNFFRPDEPEWGQYLDRAGHDLFQTAPYHKVAESNGEGRPWLAVFGDPDKFIAWPYLLNDILDSRGHTTGLRDVTSAYGPGGPVLHDALHDPEFISRAWESLLAEWRAQGVVSAFTRFHPLLRNYELLWAAAGISGKSASSRTAPSAGGKHPATVLVAVNRVTGLEPGVYRYEPRGHGLELLASGAFGDDLQRACLGQDMLSTAAAVFAWSVAPDQATQKYGERGHRYVLLDLGHACQNLYLAATALGLGCCAIGAYRDEQVNSVFSVGGISARVLYMATVGIAGS